MQGGRQANPNLSPPPPECMQVQAGVRAVQACANQLQVVVVGVVKVCRCRQCRQQAGYKRQQQHGEGGRKAGTPGMEEGGKGLGTCGGGGGKHGAGRQVGRRVVAGGGEGIQAVGGGREGSGEAGLGWQGRCYKQASARARSNQQQQQQQQAVQAVQVGRKGG